MASTDTRANELVRTIILRHDIKHDALALLADRSRTYITRIINGAHPPTADVFRALYALTADPDLITYMTGERETVTVSTEGAAPDPLPDLMDVVSGITRADRSPAQQRKANRAIAALAAYRATLTDRATLDATA